MVKGGSAHSYDSMHKRESVPFCPPPLPVAYEQPPMPRAAAVPLMTDLASFEALARPAEAEKVNQTTSSELHF